MHLSARVLYIIRTDDKAILLPESDSELRAGDQLLVVGRREVTRSPRPDAREPQHARLCADRRHAWRLGVGKAGQPARGLKGKHAQSALRSSDTRRTS